MARPTKSAHVITKDSQTKAEIEYRKKNEEILKGNADKVKPSSHLSKEQKKIFRQIVKELEASGILSNLDVFILDKAAIAIERMQAIDKMINEDIELIADGKLRLARQSYSQEFFRCCNELSLSPQSRAKLSNINLEKAQSSNDPVLQLITGGKK